MNNLSEIEKNNELRNVGGETSAGPAPAYDKQKEKARVSRPSLILCHDAHQNDASAVRKLLEKDPSLVHARDYDNQTSRGSFGEIVKAYWRGTPVAVKRILSSLSDDRLVM
ncbi:unnamed protein product [Brassica oleracea]|uniref:(rape) hypothetical protein n=1 Tax=Brassica napus TaxID=3708 RepID=A0A816QVH8_BRANA|nr:unnamed protein product [Brassica napus]